MSPVEIAIEDGACEALLRLTMTRVPRRKPMLQPLWNRTASLVQALCNLTGKPTRPREARQNHLPPTTPRGSPRTCPDFDVCA